MLSFTDTELQKKFCEGFTFYPFQSLEQHGTLIYKRYAGKGNLRKVLEWSNREQDCSHYMMKISRKLKYTDMPAAIALLDKMDAARSWWSTQLPAEHPLGKKLPGGIEKYYNMLKHYHQKVLLTIVNKLSDKYASISPESIAQMEGLINQFMQNTDVLESFLKENITKKRGFTPKMLDDEHIELLSVMTEAVVEFRALQERTIYLLDAWKIQLVLHASRRMMN